MNVIHFEDICTLVFLSAWRFIQIELFLWLQQRVSKRLLEFKAFFNFHRDYKNQL